jgi:hypothetical protein
MKSGVSINKERSDKKIATEAYQKVLAMR